jgi:hypothetical protein
MKATAQHRNLKLDAETIRRLHGASRGLDKELPAATTLSACRGGCKANSGICSL